MAPNVTVSFWNAADINGTPLLTITDEDDFFRGLKLKPDLYGLGGWELTLARRVGFQIFDSGAFQAEAFVRFMVHAWSDTEWYFGGPLQKRNQVVVHREEDGEEVFTIGGPGPKQYLDRYRLGSEETDFGSGWVNLQNGVWVWTEASTAGRILNRVIANDAAATPVTLPDLTKSFTANLDSDGNAWVEEVAEANGTFQVPIGTSLLQLIWDLEDLGALYTTVNLGTLATPAYELEAWQAYGEDVTGTDPGAGICILREGLNIANDALEVKGVGLRKFSHVIVEGRDGAWATAVRSTWSPGDYVKWGKIEYKRTANVNLLERAGLRFLRRQDNGDQEIDVEIVPGAAPDDGYYFPMPGGVLWVGNTITLDSSADGTTHTPLDYSNEDQLVTGFELELGPAGDTASADAKAKSWDVTVILNRERGGQSQTPDQSSAARIGVPDTGIQLCDALIIGGEQTARLYFSTDGGAGTETEDAAWGSNGSLSPNFNFELQTAPGGSGSATSTNDSVNLPADYYMDSQYSITLAAGDLLDALQAGGTIRMQMRGKSRHGIGIDEGAQNNRLTVGIRVMRAGVVIGTAAVVGTLESATTFPAISTYTNRSVAGSFSAVPGATVGDKLVVEVGFHHLGPVSGGTGAYFIIQPTVGAGADLPEDDSTTSDLRAWIEFRSTSGVSGSGLHPDIVGDDGRAKRCDGTEHVQRDRAPGVSDDSTLGYPVNTHWLDTSTGLIYWLIDADAGTWLPVNQTDHIHDIGELTGVASAVQAAGRWEPVTDGVDTFVWDGDEIVVTFVET